MFDISISCRPTFRQWRGNFAIIVLNYQLFSFFFFPTSALCVFMQNCYLPLFINMPFDNDEINIAQDLQKY